MTTYTWTGTGDWFSASNWNPNGVPGEGDNAVNDGVIHMTGAPGGLFDYLTIDNTNGVLVVSDDDAFFGDTSIAGGTIEGTLLVDGQDVDTLTLSGNPVFEGAGGVGQGKIVFESLDNDLVLQSGASVAGALIPLDRLNVQGSATLAASTTLEADDTFTGAATMSGGRLTNKGMLLVGAMAQVVDQLDALLNTGTITLLAGSTLTVDQGGSDEFVNTGAIAINGGELDFEATTAALSLGNVDNTGTLDVSAGVSTWSGAIDNVGGTVVASADDRIANAASITGGTLEGTFNIVGSGSLTLQGAQTFVGAAISSIGTINVQGDQSELIIDGSETLANVAITVGGQHVPSEIDEFLDSLGNDGVVTFSNTATLNLAVADDQLSPVARLDGDELVNDGVFTETVYGSVLVINELDFTNAGAFVVSNSSGADFHNAAFVNTGSISVDATSYLDFTQSLTTAQLGMINAAAGARLVFSTLENDDDVFDPGAQTLIYGTIVGGTIEGTLDVSGVTLKGSVNFAGAGGVGMGAVDDTSGELTLGDANTISNVAIDMNGNSPFRGIFIDGSATLAGATTISGGTILFDPGDALTLTGTTSLSTVIGDIGGLSFVDGTLDIASGDATFLAGSEILVGDWLISSANVTIDASIDFRGMFTLGAGADVSLTGGELDLGYSASLHGGRVEGTHNFATSGLTSVSGVTMGGAVIWVNAGSVEQSDDGLTLADEAILFNAAAGVYNLTGDSGVALGPSATGFINNAGTFERAAGPGVSDIAADVYNTGEIAIASGAIDLLGGLGGTGHIDVDSGAALDFGGAASTFVYTRNSLDLDAGASLAVNGGGAGFAGAVAISGASLDGAGEFVTFGATAASGAAVGGTLAWMNAGTVTQAGDDVALGASALLFNTLSGVYDIADDSGVSGSGLLFNKGVFAKTGGAGTSIIAANMYNSGTIEAESGALDFQGALWGPGQVEVGAGATIEIGGVAGAAVDVAFAASTGTIALDDFNAKGGSLFFGVISGFGADDAIALGAPYGADAHALFAENATGTGGVLTLVDGALTGHIALAGVYATTDFAIKAGAGGGAVVTFV